jgi:predicted dehydrogenase
VNWRQALPWGSGGADLSGIIIYFTVAKLILTHVSGNIEFASGAIATLIASFDVWDSALPRQENYGTKGTICIRDMANDTEFGLLVTFTVVMHTATMESSH